MQIGGSFTTKNGMVYSLNMVDGVVIGINITNAGSPWYGANGVNRNKHKHKHVGYISQDYNV